MEDFEEFLQRNVVFSLEGKIIKEGKLYLFNKKDYYFTFYLKMNNQEKRFELPYPFQAKLTKNYIELDYTFSAISKNDPELYYRLISLNKLNKNKFLNSKILMFEKNTLDLSLVS
jgi:hypothetical protein